MFTISPKSKKNTEVAPLANQLRNQMHELYLSHDNPEYEYVLKRLFNTPNNQIDDIILYAAGVSIDDNAKSVRRKLVQAFPWLGEPAA